MGLRNNDEIRGERELESHCLSGCSATSCYNPRLPSYPVNGGSDRGRG